MFKEGKIEEDTVDCPRFVAFKGASREDSSSSFNLGQLTKRIHGESDEFDEEEARQAQRKDRRRRAPFYLESPIGFTFTWNRPLCAVLMLLGGGGGGGFRGKPHPKCTLQNGNPCPDRCAKGCSWPPLSSTTSRCRRDRKPLPNTDKPASALRALASSSALRLLWRGTTWPSWKNA